MSIIVQRALTLLLYFQLILFIVCPVVSTIVINLGTYVRVATVLLYSFVFALPLFVDRALNSGKIN
jgi:hypothetical protein